jgi:hypothetical protein
MTIAFKGPISSSSDDSEIGTAILSLLFEMCSFWPTNVANSENKTQSIKPKNITKLRMKTTTKKNRTTEVANRRSAQKEIVMTRF